MTAPKIVMPSQIVMRATASLIGYARNSRTHDERQIDVLCKSITEYGFTNPILIDGDRGVIAGHGRIMAAEKLGLVEVPCIELRHLSNEQKRAYLLADNAIGTMSGWNEALLAQELADLSGVGIEATDLGFDAAEVDRLMETLGVDFGGKAEGDPDAVPEAPVVPTSKLGDVWLLGKHRVMCGDSTDREQVERLMDRRKADMVFTDPPYGIGVVHGRGEYGSVVGHSDLYMAQPGKYRAVLGDENTDVARKACALIMSLNPTTAIVWGANYFASSLPDETKWIVWDKKRPQDTTFSDCELAWTNKTGGIRKYEFFWHGMMQEGQREKRVHPTQKPVGLVEKVFADYPAESVLDLFGGSGSTLMACEKTEREARLMELDPAYVDVIVRRWQDFTGQVATLDGDGRTFAEIAEARRA
jgi:DNA modification methylase